MTKKPKGRKYRNLFARGGVIYYRRLVGDRRVKFSTKTDDWDEAAAVRDLWEQRKGVSSGVPMLRLPTLADLTDRYLEEGTEDLAATTRSDRHSYLREDGPLIKAFGDVPLGEIDRARLRQFWRDEIAGHKPRPRSMRTGRAYLDVLSSVFVFAIDEGIIDENPVPAFRETLRSRGRTKRGRAEQVADRHVRPIERPGEIARLLAAAEAEGEAAGMLTLLLLDAGLRLGEALGLTWGQVTWGDGPDDLRRALRIDRSRPRGGDTDTTKSGRARSVGLSRRLRDRLARVYRSRFEPGPEALVLPGLDPANFRHREWRRILKAADIGHRALKDLRDTFASQLLTSGVSLGYVSAQLGHADVQVTARHYARWIEGDSYRPPMQLAAGEIPADLLARLEWSQSGPTLVADAPEAERAPLAAAQQSESPTRSYRRGAFRNLERETGLEPATLSLGS